MHTHYDNLKVTRSAPPEVIKAAYRALSQLYHPDRNPSPDAERVMRLVNEAYAVLGDPLRRELYDRELEARGRDDRGPTFAEARPAASPGGGDAADANESGSSAGAFAAAVASAYALRAPIAPELGVSVTRCLARLFDVSWEAGIVGALLALFLGPRSEVFAAWIDEPGNPVLFALLCLPLAMVLDASLYGVAGNTPGKALLGLKVTALGGGRLSWCAYLRRNLAVWVRGLGCGIPVVSLVTMWRRGREAAAGADVAYDVKTGHQVSAKPTGVVRKLAFGVLCAALVALAPAIRVVGDQRLNDRQASLALFARPSIARNVSLTPSSRANSTAWINPRTGNPAALDALWQPTRAVAADRAPVYAFAARDGRTTVLFAAQDAPDRTMQEYVQAYLRGTAPVMSLASREPARHAGVDTGTDTVTGDAWTADGYLNAQPWKAVHVELRRIGQSYWRMVVVRSPHSRIDDDALARLMQRLWATVSGV
jgi:uncharacterized RDD family membrane protein YckC